MGLFGKKQTVVYTVPNMNCGHCEAKITERVSRLAGVSKVKADSALKTLEIQHSENAPTVEEVNQALSDTDYQAQ